LKGVIVITNWTKDSIPSLNGKVFIVTGANSGIGYESCLALAEKGATVVMACRNLERAQRSLEAIRRAVPSAKLELMELDLASLKSIHAFAETFKHKYDRLDVLINNGGTVGAARGVTADGFESQFGINHLGHFALTGLLLEVLLKTPSSRIVTVSSRMHTTGKIKWDDLMSEHSYDRWTAYRQSKLANLLFTFELNRRLEAIGTTTRAMAAHPGLAATNWAQNNFSGFMGILMKTMINPFYQSAALSALSPLYAAVDVQAKGGGYYGPEKDTRGYPVEVRAGDAAYNETDAKRLWELSEKLTGVKYGSLNKQNGA
jgi:NAD(P)-dependent dehydrogenase (short-subunit alcohol dehydrogenase family)